MKVKYIPVYLRHAHHTCYSDSVTVYLIWTSFKYFLAFYGFIDSTAKDMTGNRGSDTQQRDPGWESNPGLL